MGVTTRIELLDSPCDRCGKQSDRLHPFKLSESITYRKREIAHPWLCVRCFLVEKEKWWKSHAGGR